MTFLPRPASRLPVLIFAIVAVLSSASCHRLSKEEKAIRAELRQTLRDGSYARAEELARHALQTAPHDNWVWERLAQAQIGLHNFAAAKETLAKWRSAVRKPSSTLLEFTGDIAAEEKDPALAVGSWQRALTANPRQPRVLRKLADLEHAQHEWAGEDAALSAIIRLEETADDRMARALCRRQLHRWSEALDDYRRAQQMAPEDPDVVRGARLFERLSKFLGEIRELDARVAINPVDDQLLADRALLFLRSDDPELALEDSEAAAKYAPWAMRPRILRAIALLQLGRTPEAERLGVTNALRLEALSPEFLQTVSRLDADISVERTNTELYVARAWQLNDIGQPSLAIEDSQTALGFDAKSAGAHAEIAYGLAKLGRGDEAFDNIRQATELDANFSTAWQYRGELEMTRGDFLAAIDSLSRAIAINQTPAALQKREQCYREIGLFTKADDDHRALDALNAGQSTQL